MGLLRVREGHGLGRDLLTGEELHDLQRVAVGAGLRLVLWVLRVLEVGVALQLEHRALDGCEGGHGSGGVAGLHPESEVEKVLGEVRGLGLFGGGFELLEFRRREDVPEVECDPGLGLRFRVRFHRGNLRCGKKKQP